MIIRMKFLLLSFALGLSVTEKLHNCSSERSETTTGSTFEFNQTDAIELKLRLLNASNENTTISADLKSFPKNGSHQQNEKNISNETVTETLRNVNACREKYSIKYKKTFAFRLTGGELHRIKAGSGRNSNISVFHCNISEELVNGLKDKLHQLENFRGIIVLYPKNHPPHVSRLSGSSAQEKIKSRRKGFFPKEKTDRAERDALLKNDQIESNTKIPQISHIYLGRSLYPFLTEESRIIGRDHTLPPPIYTGPTYPDYDENWDSFW